MCRRVSKAALTAMLPLWVQGFPAFAQDARTTWSSDSLRQNQEQTSSSTTQQDEEVDAVIDQMVLLWNSHDLDHFLSLFWNSDGLVIVVDGVAEFGWNRLRERDLSSYADRTRMGFLTVQRLKIQLLAPGLAEAVCWWTFDFAGTKSSTTDVTVFRRFTDGWKVISDDICE